VGVEWPNALTWSIESWLVGWLTSVKWLLLLLLEMGKVPINTLIWIIESWLVGRFIGIGIEWLLLIWRRVPNTLTWSTKSWLVEWWSKEGNRICALCYRLLEIVERRDWSLLLLIVRWGVPKVFLPHHCRQFFASVSK
jgi:hypothetical protein